VVPEREAEARALLETYQFHGTSSGLAFLDPHHPSNLKIGILSGPNLGVVTASIFESHSGLLLRYDAELRSRHLPLFYARSSWITRLDYAIFSCDSER